MRFWSLNTVRSSLWPGNRVPFIHHRFRCAHDIYTPTGTSILHITVPPSAYPPAFPGAFASEAILPTARLAADCLLRRHVGEPCAGLLRSWFPFDVGRRIPLSAGMVASVLPSDDGIARLSIHSLLGRLISSAEPVQT